MFRVRSFIATFSVIRPIGNRAKPNRQSKPRSRHAICCGGGLRWRGAGKTPPQISRRPLTRRWFAGRSRPQWSSLGGSYPRTPNRSHRPRPSPCRPARRALPLPLPGQPRPAGHGFQSLRSQALSSPSTQGLGLAPLRRGGGQWAQSCTCGDLFRVCHPHAYARVISRFGRRIGSQPREPSQH